MATPVTITFEAEDNGVLNAIKNIQSAIETLSHHVDVVTTNLQNSIDNTAGTVRISVSHNV